MTSGLLRAQCEAELENIRTVLNELNRVVQPDKQTYTIAELAAIATFLHNAYNGIENILKRVLVAQGTTLPNVPTWHKDLLSKAAAADLISNDLHGTLSNYLSFRHYFVHAYSFSLRWEELKPLVDGIDSTIEAFKSDVYPFLQRQQNQ